MLHLQGICAPLCPELLHTSCRHIHAQNLARLPSCMEGKWENTSYWWFTISAPRSLIPFSAFYVQRGLCVIIHPVVCN